MPFITYLAPILLASTVLATPVVPRAVTKSVSTTCSYTSVIPTPTPLICGDSGAIAKVGTSILSWAAGKSDQVCLDYCKDTTACISYSFNSNNNTCEYYDASIKSSNFKRSKNGIYFWNKHCFNKDCSSTTVTISVSSSAKATTSKTGTSLSATATAKSTSSTEKSTTSTGKSTSSTKKSTTSTAKSISSTGKPSSSTAKSTSITKKSTTSTAKSTSSTEKATTSTAKSATSTKASTTKKSTTTSSTSKSATSTCTAPSSSTDSCSTLDTSILGSLLDSVTYTLYFDGKGVTENTANPGNTDVLLASTTTTLSGSLSLCDAATQCADQGTLLGLTDLYLSFDLHFVEGAACEWECVLYEGANTDATYFDVTNKTVGAVAGFSGQLLEIGL